uniref:Uncharacterized protein n=2 Tax=Cyprinus carpio TaxID=7962 RepID=A0A9J7Z223_CYPCA
FIFLYFPTKVMFSYLSDIVLFSNLSSPEYIIKRNIHQVLQRWQRAMTPSLLRDRGTKSIREFSVNYDVSIYFMNLYLTHNSPVDAPNASALAM